MKTIFKFVSICFLVASCSGSDPKVEDVGPRIDEGLYSYKAKDLSATNLPLVAIVKNDGKTFAYSFFSYQCGINAPVVSSFRKTGTTFSDNPVSAGGPNVKVIGELCDIETDIEADSNDTIKIKVDIESKPVTEYLLHKTDEDSFLTSLQNLAKGSDEFKIEEEACQEVFGTSCQELDLESKEAQN